MTIKLLVKNKNAIFKKLIIIFFFLLIIIFTKHFNFLKNLIYNHKQNQIKIAIYSIHLKNGGAERQTSLMLNYFSKVKNFKLFLYTCLQKEENEYTISKNIERRVIQNNLIKILTHDKIDILIYQFYNEKELIKLSQFKKANIIIINRSCFLHWIYYNSFHIFQFLYKIYKRFNYIISLIHFENDYLFKKWGIKSILMNNFIPFDYYSVIPSDLSSKIILMIGRGQDKIKRLDLGIISMKFIIKEIPNVEMKIISYKDQYLINLINENKLEKNIEFMGYFSRPEQFYKNASLHLFPTLAEAFPNILSETLIYGIPNILVGLDYVTTAKGGTIIVYDESPLNIAKISIKLLNNKKYRKQLGRAARRNMKKFKNDLLLKKWVKIILSIYKRKNYYNRLISDTNNKIKHIEKKKAIKILGNQLKLLKMRNRTFERISIKDIENMSYMANLK